MWGVVRAPSQCAACFSRKHVVTHRSAVQPSLWCRLQRRARSSRGGSVWLRTGGRLQGPYVFALRHCLDPCGLHQEKGRPFSGLFAVLFCPGSFLLGPQNYSQPLGWSEASSTQIFLLTHWEGVWEKKNLEYHLTSPVGMCCPWPDIPTRNVDFRLLVVPWPCLFTSPIFCLLMCALRGLISTSSQTGLSADM